MLLQLYCRWERVRGKRDNRSHRRGEEVGDVQGDRGRSAGGVRQLQADSSC